MEKEESNQSMASSPKGICEKLFSAFSAKPTQSFHRTTHHEENHVPNIFPANASQPVPSQASKNHLLGPQNTSPSSPEKPKGRKEAEVVPIEFVTFLPSPKQNASKQPITPTKEKGKPAKVAREVEAMSPQIPPHEKVKERRKSKKKVDSAPTSEAVVLKEKVVPPIEPSSKEEDKKKAGSANMVVVLKEKVEPPIVPSSEVEEKKKPRSANIDDRATEYINRAKLKIRSTSSAGVAAIGRAISFK